MLQLVQSLRSGEVEVVEVPEPRLRPNAVLVQNRWSVISPGTEQAVARTAGRSLAGKALERPDQVRAVVDKVMRDGVGATAAAVRARLDDLLTPGYSSAGVVVAVGSEVTGIRPGDRVGCVGADTAPHAELAAVPEPMCIPLPQGLDDRWGAFGAIGAIAGHGVRIAEVGAGETVAVIGLGLVGQLAAQLVTAAGGRTIAIDPDPARVELARRLGAVGGSGLDGAEAAALDATGGIGADAVIVAAATSDSGPIELAGAIARDRAVVSVVGDVGLDVPRRSFFGKELTLRVSRSYGPGRYDPAYEEGGQDYPIGYVRWTQRRLITYFFEEVAAGRIDLEPLVSHEFALADAVQAYEALQSPGRMAILLRYDAQPVQPPPRTAGAAAAPAPISGRPQVALIGPGLFARTTILPCLARADADVVAVAGGQGPRALSTARRFDVGRVVGRAAEVLDDPGVDVVVVTTRHDSHAPLTADALDRGKAVFVEKPLAIDRKGLDRLRPYLDARAPVFVDFNRRFSPAARTAIAALEGRRDPVHVQYRVNAGAIPADHWLRDPAVGGGRLVGEGCHFVDFCLAVVGSPACRIAVSGLPAGPRTLPGDSFVLTLWHEDGSLSVISYIATGSARMHKERVEILGAGRSVVIDDYRRVRRYGGRPTLRLPELGQDKGHQAAVDAALAWFRSGGRPPIAHADLLATTEITLAARDALREGRTEPLTLA